MNAGALVLAKSDGVVAVAGDLVVGDGRGADTVRLAANEQIADTATVTLRGGEVGNAFNVATFSLNGAANDTYASRIESFATLKIEGNSVLDFGGGTVCSPTFLVLDSLDVAADGLLTVTDWIEYTDFLLVAKSTFDSEELGRVVFDGYDNAANRQDYDSSYYQIVPTPPPATCPLCPFPSPRPPERSPSAASPAAPSSAAVAALERAVRVAAASIGRAGF